MGKVASKRMWGSAPGWPVRMPSLLHSQQTETFRRRPVPECIAERTPKAGLVIPLYSTGIQFVIKLAVL